MEHCLCEMVGLDEEEEEGEVDLIYSPLPLGALADCFLEGVVGGLEEEEREVDLVVYFRLNQEHP